MELATFPILTFDDAGRPVLHADGVKRLIKHARTCIAIVGIARCGKSTYLNLLCSRAADRDVKLFETGSSASDHVTVGIWACVIGTTAFVDCQGIRYHDGSKDKALLLCCHYLADVLVYNQTAILDNTIFNNLTQMAAFVALSETGQSAPPAFVVRIRDFTGDAFNERALVEKFLSPKFDDENRTMRSAFSKLFTSVRVVATDLVGKKDLELAAKSPCEFLRAHGDWGESIDAILAMAQSAAPKTGLDAAKLGAMLGEEVGLKTHDLDALKAGMELAMRRTVDAAREQFKAALPHNPAAYKARLDAVREAVASFEKQYSRVNELTYTEQRNAILGIVRPPLEAAAGAIVGALFAQWGAKADPLAPAGELAFHFVRVASAAPAPGVSPSVSAELTAPPPHGFASAAARAEGLAAELGRLVARFDREEERRLNKIRADAAAAAQAAAAAIEKIQADYRRRLMAKVQKNASSNVSRLVASLFGAWVSEGVSQLQHEMAKEVRSAYPPRAKYEIVTTVGVKFSELGEPQFELKSSVLGPELSAAEPPAAFLGLEVDVAKLRADLQRGRRKRFDAEALVFEAPVGAGLPANGLAVARSLGQKIDEHFGATAALALVRRRRGRDGQERFVFLATFAGAAVYEDFWKIVNPYRYEGASTPGFVFADLVHPEGDGPEGAAFGGLFAQASLAALRKRFEGKLANAADA